MPSGQPIDRCGVQEHPRVHLFNETHTVVTRRARHLSQNGDLEKTLHEGYAELLPGSDNHHLSAAWIMQGQSGAFLVGEP